MDSETKPDVGLIDVGKGGSESLSLGGVKVERSEVSLDGTMKGGSESDGRAVDENEGLVDVKSEENSTIEVSGTLSPTIEANFEKVSLDGVDVSVAADNVMDVKVEEKCDEADSEDSSEAESESDSSESEESSSEATSSSDDEDEEDGFVKKKAELAGQLEEGEIMDEDVEQMVAWSDDEDEVVKGPIRSKNEITVS